MRKSTKIWLMAAASSILLGGVVFTASACSIGWDFSKFSTVTHTTSTHEIEESFENISIDLTTTDVKLLPADNGVCKVVCYEDEKQRHSVSVENGTLTVKQTDERKWYEHITVFGSKSPEISVYLPQTEYASLSIKISTGDVEIPKNFTFDSITHSGSTGEFDCYASVKNSLTVKVSTGDVQLKNLSAGAVDITTTTGDIEVISVHATNDFKTTVSTGETELTDVTCKNFTSNGDTGDLEMKDVIAAEKMTIKRDTGEVELTACDAAEIFIQTDTGDVTGSLRTAKTFYADSDTGRVRVPYPSSGGKCEIQSDTGDILISVLENE